MGFCEQNCRHYDADTGICTCGRYEPCPLDEAMDRAFETYYAVSQKDPLDKTATEITVWDVYSPSELL